MIDTSKPILIAPPPAAMSVSLIAMTDVPPVAFFAMTPGELLAQVLERKGMEKAEFGRKVGGDYLKVHRWTKGIGFGARNRRRAEVVLDLPVGYFDRPDDDDEERAREAHRRKVFAEFLETDRGKKFVRDHPDMVASLNATPLPPGKWATADFYLGMALVFAGQLTEKEALTSLDWNERESRVIAAKSDAPNKKG